MLSATTLSAVFPIFTAAVLTRRDSLTGARFHTFNKRLDLWPAMERANVGSTRHIFPKDLRPHAIDCNLNTFLTAKILLGLRTFFLRHPNPTGHRVHCDTDTKSIVAAPRYIPAAWQPGSPLADPRSCWLPDASAPLDVTSMASYSSFSAEMKAIQFRQTPNSVAQLVTGVGDLAQNATYGSYAQSVGCNDLKGVPGVPPSCSRPARSNTIFRHDEGLRSEHIGYCVNKSAPTSTASVFYDSQSKDIIDTDRVLCYAMASWLSDYMYDIVINSNDGPLPSGEPVTAFPASLKDDVIARFYRFLTGIHCPISTFFLGLWFVSRLPVGIQGPCDKSNQSFRRAIHEGLDATLANRIMKAFLPAMILSNTVLSDCHVNAVTWSHVSGIPLATVNRLAVTALRLLDYSINITGMEYVKWFTYLQYYNRFPARIDCSGMTERFLVDNLISACLQASLAVRSSDHAFSVALRELEEGSFLASSSESVQDHVSSSGIHPNLMSPLHFYHAGLASSGISRTSPLTTWDPNADEIVSRPKRTLGKAPIPYSRSSGYSDTKMY